VAVSPKGLTQRTKEKSPLAFRALQGTLAGHMITGSSWTRTFGCSDSITTQPRSHASVSAAKWWGWKSKPKPQNRLNNFHADLVSGPVFVSLVVGVVLLQYGVKKRKKRLHCHCDATYMTVLFNADTLWAI